MADHVNISDPTDYGNRMSWEHRLEMEIMRVRLEAAQKERDHWKTNLEAVFTRIRRGDEVWIYDTDGSRIIVRAEPLPVAPSEGVEP